MIEEIYPITALQRKPAQIKEAAQQGIVHVTEQGSKAYVFCSEEVLEQYVQDKVAAAVSKALYDQAFDSLVAEGIHDIRQGNMYDLHEAFTAARALREDELSKSE